MFGQTFYHGTLRKYVILFGTLFNDVWINRKDAGGNVKQSFKVPLAYGPREKFLARIEGLDVDLDPQEQPFAIVLPRMVLRSQGLTMPQKGNFLQSIVSLKRLILQTKMFASISTIPFLMIYSFHYQFL